MAGVWHKCLLCDCEFFDTKQVGYLGYCPSCRDSKYPKIIIRKTTQQDFKPISLNLNDCRPEAN